MGSSEKIRESRQVEQLIVLSAALAGITVFLNSVGVVGREAALLYGGFAEAGLFSRLVINTTWKIRRPK